MTEEKKSTSTSGGQDNKKKETKKEEFILDGDQIVKKVKEIIKEGNARRVIIKSEEGKELLSVPLTVGVAGGALGVAFAAPLVAIGALAGIVTKCKLVVEKEV